VITVLSAAYGSYDAPIAPAPQDTEAQWVMVTDGQVDVPAPWRAVVEPRHHLHPRMAAKIPKCLPYLYGDGDPVIWVDASAQILRPDFVSMCIDVLGDGDVAMWNHPQRNCIVPEADVSACMGKYGRQSVVDQAAAYIKGGHPRDFGLWATGCMAWRSPAWQVRAGTEWLREQTMWTYQDQLSWPVIVRRHELDVRPLPGGLWDCTYLVFRPHGSEL
jgi:hypothetical protein